MPDVYSYEVDIKKKYLKQPTISQIFDFVNELGVTCFQFERYYSIPKGILKQVKAGKKQLPVKYWPLFYERIVPQYGTSYKIINNIIFTKKQVGTEKGTQINHKTDDSHGRLSTLK